MKILVVTPRFPYPLEKGDKLRAFHQIRHLAPDHEVILVSLTTDEVPAEDQARLRPFCSEIHLLRRGRSTLARGVLRAARSGRPLQVGYFDDPQALERVRDLVGRTRPDVVYCQLIRAAAYGRDLPVRTVIDYQDAFSAIARRRADESAVGLRQGLRLEAARIARYEREVFDWFDGHLIITAQDRDLLEFPERDRIEAIPNGVDTEFFHPPEDGVEPAHDVCFVGNLGYQPNVHASQFLVNEVLPSLRARRPGASVLLAGARPARSVLRLEGPGVTVHGWVDDIRTAYAAGRVMVAPLFTGAGQQNKILEAMAMGTPCVTSSLVNNAIGAEPGREILIARTGAEFAEQAAALLADPARADELSRNALRFVRSTYSWPSVVSRLEQVLGG